ncbi:MAG: YraN family protein [Gammaproteobacteria bacterium]|nr:YraN family protein [Gammaproteobacteria bacterium]
MADHNKHLQTGQQAEQLACDYLQQQGLSLVERNYYCRLGEIDLIMQHQTSLVFIEVRYRKNNLFGGAAESITAKKQHKLQKTALHYIQQHKTRQNTRFDVVAITGQGPQQTLEWIQNVFQ